MNHRSIFAGASTLAILTILGTSSVAILALSGAVEVVEPTSVTPEEARATYERFTALDGVWRGQSTKGWTDSVVYRTIAAGSAVLQTSFEAHPVEMMVTLIHPDGERLLLTHYCVAKNQPRLVLSEVADGGAEATFSFLDGTNMASRNKGHMDKAAFRFNADGTFTTNWTWYKDGKENWMEEIRYSRIDSGAAAPAAQASSSN